MSFNTIHWNASSDRSSFFVIYDTTTFAIKRAFFVRHDNITNQPLAAGEAFCIVLIPPNFSVHKYVDPATGIMRATP